MSPPSLYPVCVTRIPTLFSSGSTFTLLSRPESQSVLCVSLPCCCFAPSPAWSSTGHGPLGAALAPPWVGHSPSGLPLTWCAVPTPLTLSKLPPLTAEVLKHSGGWVLPVTELAATGCNQLWWAQGGVWPPLAPMYHCWE